MKKLLFLLILISSCKKEVYYYPSKSFFEENNLTEIIIGNLSFKEVTDSIRNGLFRKEKYFLILNDKNNEYRISPFTYTGGFIKEKNALEIVDDSIYVSVNKFPLTELNKYLKLHFENNGKLEYLSDSYKRAFIKLVLETDDSSTKLNELLLRIIKTYDKTNIVFKDSINLNIMLSYSDGFIFKIPPPPIPLDLKDKL